MSILIEKIELKDKILVYLNSGDVFSLPYDYTSLLSKSTKESLENYHLIGGGRGVHFEDIDEDISLRGIIQYKLKHDLIAS
jgi:hypothetical protein